MKKILLFFIALSFIVPIALQSQSLAGVKICVNPGHRGYNPAYDREIPLAPGITYWESEGNLSKGLYLKDILESLGATVIMTRTTQVPSVGIETLSQIVAVANANNVDYFQSIHSNAFPDTAIKKNTTLILFQGRTNAPTYLGARTMADYLADEIFKVNRTTSKSVAGDFDFYGTGQAYLGVFKGLNMPGTLTEGSMHDYTPETWRLKNESYLKHEAWAIARAYLPYFLGGTFPTGIVAGILRDEKETVPASYKPISSTNDRFKPLNQIKVRMEPGGRIYNGDNYNNGFYFFDKVTPGNYKLYFEAENMKNDSASVVVYADESVFADKLMTLKPILDPPVIVSSTPSNNLTEVSNVTDIVIQFNIRMNTSVTQNAVTISPAVSGSYKWDTNEKILTFTPAQGYVQGTKYTVTISTAAKTFFDINLPLQQSFNFTTRSQLNLLSTYPVKGSSDISTSVLMSVRFDKGISAQTLANRITFTDGDRNNVTVQVNQNKYNIGIIEFEPKTSLNYNTLYKITLKAGIGDVEYVTFPQDAVIEFTTEKNYTFTGSVIDGFELLNVWQSPLLSSNTAGIISSQTSFAINSSRKKYGSTSGKLDYGFSGTSGVVDLGLLNPIALGSSGQEGFGVWVFGDNSNNTLEYRFLRENSTEQKVKADSINWTGWKLKKILLSDIPGAGSIQFKSIAVVQSSQGNKSGTLYFDDCTTNIITGIRENNSLPLEFSLEQNYPNPFNPSTLIRFTVPVMKNGKTAATLLKVYDLLGRKIASLVNEEKTPGNYSIEFNGAGLPSGIYMYTIQSGEFFASKKLMLLK